MTGATPKGNLMTKKSEFVETPGAVVDLGREARCGFSEVIYGESKTAEDILAIARALFERGFDVFATRVSEEKAQAVMPALAALSRIGGSGAFRGGLRDSLGFGLKRGCRFLFAAHESAFRLG